MDNNAKKQAEDELMCELEKGEQSAKEKGWISSSEVKNEVLKKLQQKNEN